MFKINIIKTIKRMYWTWEMGKQLKENDDTYEFIWGIKAGDDLSKGTEANLYTMNDFDVTYNKKSNTFSLSMETIYMFKNGRDGEKKYVQSILNKFTEWMDSKGYDTTKNLCLGEVFTDGKNVKTEFETIEDLYACFRFLATGYINS